MTSTRKLTSSMQDLLEKMQDGYTLHQSTYRNHCWLTKDGEENIEVEVKAVTGLADRGLTKSVYDYPTQIVTLA